MPVHNRIASFHDEMVAWRRQIHSHPETAFEEHRTAAAVAEKLRSFGIAVDEGLARTGVVGRLEGLGGAGPTIGLRADMDALHIHEQNDVAHRSRVEARCMPAAMTATRRCCSAPRSTWRRRRISPAR